MPQIPQPDITHLKQTTDLVALIKSHNIKLRKTGNTYKGHCPFHDDKKTPSLTVNPSEELWHCFGCDSGGDAIRFVEKIDNVSFPTAIATLMAKAPKKAVNKKKTGKTSKASNTNKLNQPNEAAEQTEPVITPAQRTKLLTHICDYYQQQLKQLQQIGILNAKGDLLMQDCIVFPLTQASGAIVNLYARRITEGNYNHLYLPGERQGLFNPNASQRGDNLIITESVIDALSLIQHGYHNVMPCYGTNGLTPDLLAHLTSYKSDIIIVFDGDESGIKGASKVKQRLINLNHAVSTIELPEGEDVNSYFNSHDQHDFQVLLDQTRQADADKTIKLNGKNSVKNAKTSNNADKPLLKKHNGGFLCRFGQRTYEVKAIAKQSTQLKTTIKAYSDSAKGFELHTLDLYSARSREAYIKSCAVLFKQPSSLITTDMTKLIDYV
jgi:DNA primase